MVGKVNDAIYGKTSQCVQWEYASTLPYQDPFNEIELDIHITSADGERWVIPSFWRGEERWGVRFMTDKAGIYHIKTYCTDTSNQSLHHVEHMLVIKQENIPVPQRLQVSSDKRYLEDTHTHPFLWLADTWWMGLCDRLSYRDFQYLTQYRKTQGFNVIMLVAGLFPDMDSFDSRGENVSGFPWESDYTAINPAYFDEADERIEYLLENGLIPTILGSWGYYLQHLGEKKMKQHWRYIIARWGAYPVVWCIAGEATMPYYLSQSRTEDMYALHEGWTRLAHYIKSIEPFGNLVTIHPTEIGRDQLQDPSVLDFNLIQAGHEGYKSINNAHKLIAQERHKEPLMPLVVGEMNYEGILQNTHPSMQRLCFWTALLSGAKGYSYGANGVWQINTHENPFGASPHGENWGDVPWRESYLYEGAMHLGYAKKLLAAYPWWLFEPHPEWISPQRDMMHYKSPKVAGIPEKVRMIYFYTHDYRWWHRPKFSIEKLESHILYHAFFWNPRDAKRYPLGDVIINKKGAWRVPKLPTKEDWVLILETKS